MSVNAVRPISPERECARVVQRLISATLPGRATDFLIYFSSPRSPPLSYRVCPASINVSPFPPVSFEEISAQPAAVNKWGSEEERITGEERESRFQKESDWVR